MKRLLLGLGIACAVVVAWGAYVLLTRPTGVGTSPGAA